MVTGSRRAQLRKHLVRGFAVRSTDALNEFGVLVDAPVSPDSTDLQMHRIPRPTVSQRLQRTRIVRVF